MYLGAAQLPAPGALVQAAGNGQGALQQGSIELELQSLLAPIALAAGRQAAQLGFPQDNALGVQFDPRLLGAIERCIELQALQALVGVGQALSLQAQLALWRLLAARQVELALQLPL
ncbi:hypothetical protein D3C71_1825090 [compost metagenome]